MIEFEASALLETSHRMTVRHEFPPNIAAIDKAFNVRARRNVIFAYGDTIFAPHLDEVPAHLIAHETVHGERQSAFPSPAIWWERYIEERPFRLAEEIYAHAAEYEYLAGRAHSRSERRFILRGLAEKLAAPLYGRLCSRERAKFMIARVAN